MRAFRRMLLPLVLLSALSACQGWNGHRLRPEPRELPSPLRVTMTDGSRLVVWNAEVARDSLVGLVGKRPEERTRAAVPLSQVRRTEARGVDFVETVGLTAAITVLAAASVVFAAMVALGSGGSAGPTP